MFAPRFGVMLVQDLPWPRWRSRLLDVERLGYDGAYVWDHLVHRTLAPEDPLLEAFTLLGAAAAVTTTIRLGTLVASPTIRHPYLLAKQAYTLDHLSGGRLDLGIGAAGVPMDYAALGIEPWDKAEQVARFLATVETVARGLYRNAPPPARERLPLTIAAHGPRTLRIAAAYADTWTCISPRDAATPDEALARAGEWLGTFVAYAAEAGRDPAALRRGVVLGSEAWPVRASIDAYADAVRRHRDLGFTDFVLVHPDHPAEARSGHGGSAPDIVARVGAVLADLRRDLA